MKLPFVKQEMIKIGELEVQNEQGESFTRNKRYIPLQLVIGRVFCLKKIEK
jgi:hypothetical protein